MQSEKSLNSTAFGRQLKMWRQRRGLSQLELATAAATTPRHLSFVESGRSRPGQELVLRLAKSLDLTARNQNELLIAAGLPAQFKEHALTDEQLRPFMRAVEQIIESHNPFPACVHDNVGKVLTCNAAHRVFAPGCEQMSPEELVDMIFAPGIMRNSLENWSEVAWAWVDRHLRAATDSKDERLTALVDRAMDYLADVKRPNVQPDNDPDVLTMNFRFGDRVVRVFSTVMRFESAMDVTLSELKVELMFPLDEEAREFFQEMAKATHVK